MSLPDYDAQWNYADPSATEATFRQLLAAHPDAPATWRHGLETQLVRTLGLQRRFDEGHAALDALEPRLQADGAARPRVRAALERGRLLNSAGQADAARPHFEHALRLADEAGGLDALAIDAVHMLAIVASSDEAMQRNLEAVRRAEASDEPAARRWLGSLYNNLGWTCHDDGDFDAAHRWFLKALAVHRERGAEPGLRIARWAVARTLRSLGRTAEALAEQQDILGTYGEEQVSGHVFLELGECLSALGREEEATPHFEKAREKGVVRDS